MIPCQGGKLLVDAGWKLAQFTSQLKVYQVAIREIRYVMFTHHHHDHAGLVQNIRDLSGAKLIIEDHQIPYLEQLRAYFEKKGGYEPIRVEKSDLINPGRQGLLSIGVRGEIIATPGHSDDSISLVLDNGAAFIGDLPAPDFVDDEAKPLVVQSWKKLLAHGAQVFYHSHTDPIPAEQIRNWI